jgi:hypothetical protein
MEFGALNSYGCLVSNDPYLLPGDDVLLYGTVATANCVSYPSNHVEQSDGALSPKLVNPVDSGHHGSPDPAFPYDLNSDHTVYGYTATLFAEYLYSHMNKQYSVLGSPPGIDYDVSQAIELYTPQGQGLTNDVMSIAGTRVPLEKISCIYDGCTTTFTRIADLDRHVLNVHNRVGHHCQVPGCNNNKGNGYCRPDKLKAHMWEKHGLVADLSYTKAVPSSFDMLE